MAWPAVPGRYLFTSSDRLPGRKPATIGSANSTPNRAEIPPAVLRSRVPRARPSRPATARYSAQPITARVTPGWLSVVDRCCRARMDCPAVKVTNEAGRPMARIAAVIMAALPHKAGSRFGTAATVVLISPVAYSLVISSTPSTPTAICASSTPDRLTETGSNEAVAAPCGGLATRSRLYSTPNATTRTTAESSDHRAAGWVRSLVHSDFITRAWVRSEEHTSELQSPVHLVCRLLLEKKKHLYHLALLSITMATPVAVSQRSLLINSVSKSCMHLYQNTNRQFTTYLGTGVYDCNSL